METSSCINYTGRFAPSPSGPLHDGSLVAAMASFLDARAHQGKWLLRMEDIDTPRTVAGADRFIMQQLLALQMQWDGNVIWQSSRLQRYNSVFQALQEQGLIYGCACTRKEIAENAKAGKRLGLHGERPYAGTCRHGISGNRPARAWRLLMPEGIVRFTDRWQGEQSQDVANEVGDIIVKRADGLFAYQLVVVIDDHDQGVTDIVRGNDLLSSTARQHCIARMLGYAVPLMMHVPLVMDETGRKLSKQNHATAIDLQNPLLSLGKAWQALGFSPLQAASVEQFWQAAIPRWHARFGQ
ncbi:MAG: tRNA glutamyl-Q(34) synthetase GluQRS [Alcaligenaceae bacterium]|nr:tRNA glutamyl-Q(34) synthetase GluQRS [Alcaligenaceae bacterium]